MIIAVSFMSTLSLLRNKAATLASAVKSCAGSKPAFVSSIEDILLRASSQGKSCSLYNNAVPKNIRTGNGSQGFSLNSNGIKVMSIIKSVFPSPSKDRANIVVHPPGLTTADGDMTLCCACIVTPESPHLLSCGIAIDIVRIYTLKSL